MRHILFTLLLLPVLALGQARIPQVDTIIKCTNYVSYFSYKQRNPIVLTYKLYKGGGPCSRAGFRFKNDLNIPCLTDKDYLKTGYDKGHLANAEDFAYNCVLDELTFRYYNCVPQTKTLNRGIWKQYETKVRDFSQTDSVLVICFNDFSTNKVEPVTKMPIPTYCVKALWSLSKNQWLFIAMFENDLDPVVKEITSVEFKNTFKVDLSSLIK